LQKTGSKFDGFVKPGYPDYGSAFDNYFLFLRYNMVKRSWYGVFVNPHDHGIVNGYMKDWNNAVFELIFETQNLTISYEVFDGEQNLFKK